MPSNRPGPAIIAQQGCKAGPVPHGAEDEPMNARAHLITWMLAVLPAIAALWQGAA
jgi:hypothetical protein